MSGIGQICHFYLDILIIIFGCVWHHWGIKPVAPNTLNPGSFIAERSVHLWATICLLDRHSFYRDNTLRQRQNGRHFAANIFKYIFFNESLQILIQISLKFVTKGPINSIQHWFREWLDADQVTSHYLNQWWLVYLCIYMHHLALMSLYEIVIQILKCVVLVWKKDVSRISQICTCHYISALKHAQNCNLNCNLWSQIRAAGSPIAWAHTQKWSLKLPGSLGDSQLPLGTCLWLGNVCSMPQIWQGTKKDEESTPPEQW